MAKIHFLAIKSSRSVLQPSSNHCWATFHSSFQGLPLLVAHGPMAINGHFGHITNMERKGPRAKTKTVLKSVSKLQQLDSMPNLKFQAFLDKNHSSNKAFFSQKFTAQVHTCLISQQFVVSPRVIQFPHSCFCTAIRYVLLPSLFPCVFNTNGRLVMLWILSVYIYFAVSADCIRGDLGTSQLWFCTLCLQNTLRGQSAAL